MDRYRNILLAQLGDIGDVVLTTPTIRAVKETYPQAQVSIMVRKPFGSLLRADPFLHEVVEVEKPRGALWNFVLTYVSLVRRLRRARYDLVIDLRTGDRGAIICYCTGAEERVGRQGGDKQKWHDLLFTRVIRDPEVVPHVHPGADQSLRIVRPLGIDTPDSRPRLHVDPADRSRALGLLTGCGLSPTGCWLTVNPFSRWSYKEWDSGKWGEVIDQLWRRYRIPALLIGDGNEFTRSETIVKGREGRVLNVAGKTTLGELVALISMSTLHMGVDSAAPHIAAAVGTPSVTLHGPSDWRAWRMADDMQRVVSSDMPCVPCYHMGCDDSQQSCCMQQLTVEAVLQSVDELLRKTGLNRVSWEEATCIINEGVKG